jgi:hypothetical protein
MSVKVLLALQEIASQARNRIANLPKKDIRQTLSVDFSTERR